MKKTLRGEELIDVDFNPSANSNVQFAKERAIELINVMNRPGPALSDPERSDEYMMLYTRAIQDVIAAQMMVVKVLTFKN